MRIEVELIELSGAGYIPAKDNGWQRDLMRECVEPNPGPSALDVLELFAKKAGVPSSDPRIEGLLNYIKTKAEFPNSDDVDCVTPDVLKTCFPGASDKGLENLSLFLNEARSHFKATSIPPVPAGPSSAPGAGLQYLQSRLQTTINMNIHPKATNFQNRTREIATMAYEYLKNATTPAAETSTIKATIIVSTQMWGSGKTWLGSYFLDELGKHNHVLGQLTTKFGETAVNNLLGAYYVLIDFRKCLHEGTTLPLEELLKAEIIRHLFHLPVESCTESAKMNLVRSLYAEWLYLTVDGIVARFCKFYGKQLFLHFDEVDVLLSHLSPALVPTSFASIQRLYKFWTLMSDTLSIAPIYCSGRTSLLYALGRHMYASSGIISPFSQSLCILLSPFKYYHILELVRSVAESRRLARQIYFYTKGIPRLVSYAIMYIAADNKTMLNGKDLLAYTRRGDGELELFPVQGKDLAIVRTYLKFIRVAALGMPIALRAYENPADWGILDTDEAARVPLLEVIRMFNLYIEEIPLPSNKNIEDSKNNIKDRNTDKGDTEMADYAERDEHKSESRDRSKEGKEDEDEDEDVGEEYEDEDEDKDDDGHNSSSNALDCLQSKEKEASTSAPALTSAPASPELWRVTFPPLVLDNLANQYFLHDGDITLFWAALYRATHRSVKLEDIAEDMARNAMILRFGELCHLGNHPLTFSQLLPFYKGSYFGEVPVQPKPITKLEYKECVQPFVKISKKAKRFSPNTPNKPNNISEALANIQDRLDRGEPVSVHPDDWRIIGKLIKLGVILVPGSKDGKSASGDYFYYASCRRSTHYQIKYWSEDSTNHLKPSDFVDEIQKVAPALVTATTITLVFVCLAISSVISENASAVKVIHDGVVIALRFDSKAEIDYGKYKD